MKAMQSWHKVRPLYAVLACGAVLALGTAARAADGRGADVVDESLRWAPKPVLGEDVKGNPTESPYHDPQATPMPLAPYRDAQANPIPLGRRETVRRAADCVPPEILSQCDPDVLSGKRPSYVTIRQADIYDLRDHPTVDADFVRLDIHLHELSTGQRTTLHDWCTSGHNKIMLMGYEIHHYAEFLGAREAFFHSEMNSGPRQITVGATTPLAVEAADVSVPFDWRESEIARDFFWEGINVYRTPQVVTLAWYTRETNMRPFLTKKEREEKRPEDLKISAYGSFPAGQSMVYFRPSYLATGGDGYRFELNWSHWVLGLKIPSPTEKGLVSGPMTVLPTNGASALVPEGGAMTITVDTPPTTMPAMTPVNGPVVVPTLTPEGPTTMPAAVPVLVPDAPVPPVVVPSLAPEVPATMPAVQPGTTSDAPRPHHRRIYH